MIKYRDAKILNMPLSAKELLDLYDNPVVVCKPQKGHRLMVDVENGKFVIKEVPE